MSEPSWAAASRNLPISSMKRRSPPWLLGSSAATFVSVVIKLVSVQPPRG